jgi:hypothetical protein
MVTDNITPPLSRTAPLVELTPDSINLLADRLYSLGISNVAIFDQRDRSDLVTASRALRRILQSYERATGRPLHTILLCGGAS